MKKQILVFCDYFKPGYKSGGGTWTVVNLVDRFRSVYDFHIVTRNHDGVSDRRPYQDVVTDEWNEVDGDRVFYSVPERLTRGRVESLFNDVKPDAVFLNSAFSMPARRFLAARRRGLGNGVPVILAPCGEMSKGALSLKPFKKKLFLKYARLLGLYDGVIWKASFEAEADEIRQQFGEDITVMVAPDLAPKTILPDFDPAVKPKKSPGSVKFAFISRLTRKKNIHYFLERLREINVGSIEMDMIGPLEDAEYWAECRKIIESLPKNIKVTATGAFPLQMDALQRLSTNHFFVLPTLNENFGYVFIEALAAGCPVLTSENTVWKDFEDRGIGWITPLDKPDGWKRTIEQCIAMGPVEYEAMSNAAREFAIEWLLVPEHDEATARVFERALQNSRAVSR